MVYWLPLRIGRLRVRLHLLLPVAAALMAHLKPDLAARYLLLLGVLGVHELGHALTSLALGGGQAVVSVSPVFGWARVQRFADRREAWVALAGPAANLVVAGGALLAGAALDLRLGRAAHGDFLLTVNLAMAVGNLVPARITDGGRALSALWPSR